MYIIMHFNVAGQRIIRPKPVRCHSYVLCGLMEITKWQDRVA